MLPSGGLTRTHKPENLHQAVIKDGWMDGLVKQTAEKNIRKKLWGLIKHKSELFNEEEPCQ